MGLGLGLGLGLGPTPTPNFLLIFYKFYKNLYNIEITNKK